MNRSTLISELDMLREHAAAFKTACRTAPSDRPFPGASSAVAPSIDGVESVTPATIVLATDLSCRCDRALDRAIALASEWRARLVMVHALRERGDAAPGGDMASWRRPRDSRQAARDLVRRDIPNAGDIGVELIVEWGDPTRVILDAARRVDCGLLLTGVPRDETLARSLIGSTLDKVIRKADVPVLVVKERRRGPYHNVIIAADFSEAARHSLTTALRLLPKAQATIFHACDVPFGLLARPGMQTLESLEREARLEASEFLRGTPAAAGRPIPIMCGHGEIGTLLQDAVETVGADLVVVGTRGRSALSSLLLESVAKNLLSSVTADVLIVRHRGSDAALSPHDDRDSRPLARLARGATDSPSQS
ncbi:MAG TPA: universal stress protein [Verrucomicrobiae bacterium]|nr:universal stress protein [Verrucomicrobiae bacterium]